MSERLLRPLPILLRAPRMRRGIRTVGEVSTTTWTPTRRMGLSAPWILVTALFATSPAHAKTSASSLTSSLNAQALPPIVLSDNSSQRVVRNCNDWLSLAAAGFQPADDMPGSDWQTYSMRCLPLFFQAYSVASKSRAPSDALQDARLLPANILPTMHTESSEYTAYRTKRTSLASLIHEGAATLSITRDEMGRTSTLIGCANDPAGDCSDMSITLTEVARGDFLAAGTQQVLARRVLEVPDGHPSNYESYLLFVPNKLGAPFDAELFRLDCEEHSMQNLSALAPVPCVTAWPTISEPPPSSIGQPPRPSFDCSKARRPLEHLICSDVNLAAQDAYLAYLYRLLLRRDSIDERAGLRQDESLWLKGIAAKCGPLNSPPPPNDVSTNGRDCVVSEYKFRQLQLRNLLPVQGGTIR